MPLLADLTAQALNGLAYGALLFLLSVGLTLIFGMLDVINLAHGSLYMLGAYTGLALIGEPVPIQRYLPSPGGSDESVFLFCGRVDATVAGGVHGLAEEHEDIRVVVKPLAEIETLLDQGAIESGHTLIGLYWLLRHRDHLRQLWAAD